MATVFSSLGRTVPVWTLLPGVNNRVCAMANPRREQVLQVDNTRFLFPLLSIPPRFTYSAAHGNSNSVCLGLRRPAVAVVLSD